MRRILVCLGVLLAGAGPLAAFDGPTQSAGGAKKTGADGASADAKAKKDSKPSTAERMLDAGVKAYESGKAAQAIRAFTTALSGGGLKNPQMARALYYRGLAYRKKGKPGLAISDLSSAVWLKNGLSPTEKQNALSNRIAAYRDAGISDVPGLSQSVAVSEAPTGWQTAMNGQALPATAPAPAPSPAPIVSTPPKQSSSSSSSGGIGGFFTNLFGGSSSGSSSTSNAPPPSSAPASVATTASVAQNNPAPAAGWTTTEVATANSPSAMPAPQPPPRAAPPPAQSPPQQASEPAPFVTEVAVAPQSDAPQPSAAPAPKAEYQVQVAAVRTRQEAYAISVRLVSQHGSELGGRRPSVDETVIGSMGTFYRVRLGPFASADEPKRLCGSFRASGFDCLVVTQ